MENVNCVGFLWPKNCVGFLWPFIEWMSNALLQKPQTLRPSEVKWSKLKKTLKKKKKDALHTGTSQSHCRRGNLRTHGLRFCICFYKHTLDVGPWVGCPTFQNSPGKWRPWVPISEPSCEDCVNLSMWGTWHNSWHIVKAQVMVTLALIVIPRITGSV